MFHVSQLFAQFAWMKIVCLQRKTSRQMKISGANWNSGVRVKAEKEEECEKFWENRYSTEYVLSQTQETSAIAQNTVAGLVFGVLSHAGKFESDF